MNKNREEKQNNGNQKKIDPARRIFYGVALGVGALPVRAEYAGSVGVDIYDAEVSDERQDNKRNIGHDRLPEQFQGVYVRIEQQRFGYAVAGQRA